MLRPQLPHLLLMGTRPADELRSCCLVNRVGGGGAEAGSIPRHSLTPGLPPGKRTMPCWPQWPRQMCQVSNLMWSESGEMFQNVIFVPPSNGLCFTCAYGFMLTHFPGGNSSIFDFKFKAKLNFPLWACPISSSENQEDTHVF